MTPLARRILTELTKPVKDRRLSAENKSVWPVVGEAHCFDLSDVQEIAYSAGKDYFVFIRDTGYLLESKYLFLPFPTTLIEFQWGGRQKDPEPRWWRQAFLAEQVGQDDSKVRLTWIHDDELGAHAVPFCVFNLSVARGGARSGFGYGALMEDVGSDFRAVDAGDGSGKRMSDMNSKLTALFVGSLMVTNTRSGFDKRTFQTHAGFQRNMLKNVKMVGKFPLHAWTKITLLPPKEGQAKETEAHATGQRCLHYVRQHYKKTTGQYVVAHARGNPALGVRNSYYHLPSGR